MEMEILAGDRCFFSLRSMLEKKEGLIRSKGELSWSLTFPWMVPCLVRPLIRKRGGSMVEL